MEHFLTVSFNHTVAVVANVSKQLWVKRRDESLHCMRHRHSNTYKMRMYDIKNMQTRTARRNTVNVHYLTLDGTITPT